MGRAPCCDKGNVKKGPWSPEEDATLKSYIQEHGPVGNWIALPQKIGIKRCGKSCRLRWLNYLRPNIKHGGFSEEEDRIICCLYISIGSRWSIIAAQLPGRTDNDIKNYWNTKLKKKLFGKQRKKGNQAQKNSSKRGISMKKISSEKYNCSATSGTESGWSELPQGVTNVPLAGMNQNPNLMTTSDPTSIWDLLAQFGGMVSPIQGLEPDQINTEVLQYPNESDKIPPHGYYPFEHAAGRLTSSQTPVCSSINEDPTGIYKTSRMDSVDNPADLYHNVLPDFPTNQVEYCGQQNLLQGPGTSDIYGTDEMMNISICSSTDTLINNSHGNNIIWEDISSILADVGGACRPPLLCEL